MKKLVSYCNILLLALLSLPFYSCKETENTQDQVSTSDSVKTHEYSPNFQLLFETDREFRFQKYFGKNKEEIRGLEIAEHEENDDNFFSYSYDFDMNQNAEIEYHFNEKNIVDSVVLISYHQEIISKDSMLTDIQYYFSLSNLPKDTFFQFQDKNIRVKESILKHNSYIEVSVF